MRAFICIGLAIILGLALFAVVGWLGLLCDPYRQVCAV